MNNGYSMSEEAAIRNLKVFFANTDGDEVTRDEIYVAAKRDLSQVRKNKSWLSNKTSTMKKYGFFTKVYSNDSDKRFVKMVLTERGKEALGRNKTTSVVQPATAEQKDVIKALAPVVALVQDQPKPLSSHQVDTTLEAVTRVIDAFNRLNPSWEWVLVRKEKAQQ